MELKERVAVVTGAASGIGLALARRLALSGAVPVLADIKDAPDVTTPGGRPARFVPTDVGTEAGIRALVDDVLAHEGRIDLFVSNAGIGGIDMLMDATASEADWERIIAVNQMSHVRAARHVVPHMLARGSGHFLITASAASLLNSFTSIGYAVTKYASLGFAEWLAFSYRSRGLGVSALCPGSVRTPMIEGIAYLQPDAISPEEVAEAAVAGLVADRFMITTHSSTLEYFRQKAGDYEAYIDVMTAYRDQAIALQAASAGET